MSKRLGGDQRLQIQNLFMASTGSPMEITMGQQYNVGEKPTVILYTQINRHAGTPEKTHMFHLVSVLSILSAVASISGFLLVSVSSAVFAGAGGFYTLA